MQERMSGASYGLSTLLVWMGGLNWPVISMVLGCILGIATFILNWRFQVRKLQVLQQAAERGYLNEPKRELRNRDS